MIAHLSPAKMAADIQLIMNWPSLMKDVKAWVKICPHCQLFRRDRNDKPEYQFRRIPHYPMQRISMDFVSLESATARGPYRLLVIVDELTRYAEAVVTPDEKGKTAADVLMKHIICRYGVPEEIVTDQGSAFISDLFENLCYQLAVDKIFTTAYHPQGNGINERMHGTLYNILRSLTGTSPQAWKAQLPYALFIYRTSYHKSINMSPHKALYGYEPRHVALDMLPLDDYFPLDERLKSLIFMHDRCLKYLEKQQEKRNDRLNENKVTPEYERGDLVKLRIHERANKLSPFWKGPYKILRKVNNVNYEVELPNDTNMSKIIHVQHIKPWYGPTPNTGSQPVVIEKISRKEKAQEQIQNRPITRAYKKILDKIQREKEETKPVAAIYDVDKEILMEYLYN
jgi:transposase InsO family protein/ribosomal protein L21E